MTSSSPIRHAARMPQSPTAAQMDARLDRLIPVILAVAVLGVQGAWTVFLAWAALYLLW